MPFFKKIIALCFFWMSLASADVAIFSQDTISMDTSRQQKFQRYSAVPVIGYTEETRMQLGAMILFFLKPDEIDGKVPEIGVTAYGSSRGQFQFTLEPYFYFCRDKISLWFDLEYQDWFASYFGQGNSPDIDEFTNYNRKKLYFGAKVESRLGLPDYLKYGLELHIESSEIDFKKSSSMPLPDPHSGNRNGVGYLLGLDTRDNTNWTQHGYLIEWKQIFFSDQLGDYSFDKMTLDMRAYTILPFRTTAAFGFLWQRANGDVPFDMLAGPDGIKRFRGVESLYFGDNQAVILQSEIRKYFGWLLGGHVFVESGKAGAYFSELMRNEWHRSVGAGALLALNKNERLFARADVSWIDFDHIGLSFYVRQAF